MKQLQHILTLLSVFALALSSCNLEDDVIMNGLEIIPRSLNIVKGETSTLGLTFAPAYVADKTVFWESSDMSVITVDADGNVTAIAPGTAVITAISNGVMAVCDVNVVNANPTVIELDKTSMKLFAKESYTIKVSSVPQDADLSALEWKSSAPEIASVDGNGKVMGISDGNAVITVTAGEAKAECNVTVVTKAMAGDFFYSDGTWSSGLDASKTVVGVVFWSGDATADDPLMAAAHPECKNGLAVALTESVTAFQANWSKYNKESVTGSIQDWADKNMPECKTIISGLSRGENGNYILGYNNTEILLGFNADPENAEWKIGPSVLLADYKNSNPLPENTSGWYIPSIKELCMLCDGYTDANIFWNRSAFGNMGTINNALSKVSGSTMLGQGINQQYWSSTEHCTSSKQYFLHFKYVYVASSISKTASNTVRFVFAF